MNTSKTTSAGDFLYSKFVLITDTPEVKLPYKHLLSAGGTFYKVEEFLSDTFKIMDNDVLYIRRALIVTPQHRASVVWGTGTYSDNHSLSTDKLFVENPLSVEVMIYETNDLDIHSAIYQSGYLNVTDFNEVMSPYFSSCIIGSKPESTVNTIFEF